MLRAILRISSNYLFAALMVALACAGAAAIYHFDANFRQHGFFGLFLVAVALSAWRSGFQAAIFAIILSVLAATWMLPPHHTFHIHTDDLARIAVFAVVATLISSLHAARERTEKRLHESEQRLGFALESSGIGCWDADIKNGIFWRSSNLPDLYGRSDNDFSSTCEGFFAYIHPEDRDFFRLASVKGGLVARTYEITHRVVCADGTVRKVHTRGRMYLDSESKIERMVGAVHLLEHLDAKSQPMAASPTAEPIAGLAGLTGTESARARPRSTESDQASLLR